MKILHTSDWHLGKRLENFSRLEEQREVMDEIIALSKLHQVEVVLIAGDIFDTFNPPNEAIELFYKTVKELSNNGNTAVIAIAGNHDSPDRIEAPDPLARECGIYFSGFPDSVIPVNKLSSNLEITQTDVGFIELTLPTCNFPLRLIHTPYANELRLKKFLGYEDEQQALQTALAQQWQNTANKYCDDKGVNLLMTHLFMINRDSAQPEEPEDEKPILHVGGAEVIYTDAIPKQIQYVALGHLHRKQKFGTTRCPVVYCGSPIAYSFAEANQQKRCVLVEATPNSDVTLTELPLSKGKKLLRQKCTTVDEAIEWLNNHQDSLVELTLVSDEYVKATDRKRLNDCHSGIVSIIPEIRNNNSSVDDDQTIDLSQNMNALFTQYFQHKTGLTPNEQILDLFKEICNEKE